MAQDLLNWDLAKGKMKISLVSLWGHFCLFFIVSCTCFVFCWNCWSGSQSWKLINVHFLIVCVCFYTVLLSRHQGFGVLSVILANHAIKLLTSLFQDLQVEALHRVSEETNKCDYELLCLYITLKWKCSYWNVSLPPVWSTDQSTVCASVRLTFRCCSVSCKLLDDTKP